MTFFATAMFGYSLQNMALLVWQANSFSLAFSPKTFETHITMVCQSC